MPNIVILVHRHDAFEGLHYLLHEISEIWRENGLSVNVSHGPTPDVSADLAILHVDLTVVPDDYLAFVRHYPVVLNGSVIDVSKRLISDNLARRDDGYEGPVVAKTNRNFGGRPEARLIYKGPLLRRKIHWFRNKLPWSYRSQLFPSEYRIFESTSQVPRVVWHNPHLIVERFLSECQNGLYCLRTWVFLGDRETNTLSHSHEPIVKAANTVRRERVAEVPDELRRIRRNLGFDFGKFDYAIVDGRVVLYDVNPTPTVGNMREQFLPNIQLLAEGIGTYL